MVKGARAFKKVKRCSPYHTKPYGYSKARLIHGAMHIVKKYKNKDFFILI